MTTHMVNLNEQMILMRDLVWKGSTAHVVDSVAFCVERYHLIYTTSKVVHSPAEDYVECM